MDDQSTAPTDTSAPFSGTSSQPLTYEETPILEPVIEAPPVRPTTPSPYTPSLHTETELPDPLSRPELPPDTHTSYTPPSYPVRSGGGPLQKIIAIVILFGVGLFGSIIVRQYLATGFTPGSSSVPRTPEEVGELASTPTPEDPYAEWKTYEVMSGATKQPIAGVQFKLPPEVLEPICDGTTCISQGTYLPGGTRFTVAPRGKGQLLTDYRGKIITDLKGNEFVSTESAVATHPAISFSGDFIGSTVGGYAFSRMHGVMVEVTDTLSLEINHFTPSGVEADFATDDELFEKILKSLVIGAAVTPTESPFPTSSASVTEELPQ